MVALAPNSAPLFVRLPDGRVVPTNGGLVDPLQSAPIAGAELTPGGGALGGGGSATPQSRLASMVRRGGGGAARGGDIDMPAMRRPRPMQQDNGGGANIGALVALIAKNAATPTPTTVAPAPANTNETALGLKPPGSSFTAAPENPRAGGGITDWLKDMFHGPEKKPMPATPTETALGLTPPGSMIAADEGPDFFTRLQGNPMALALVTGGLQMLGASNRPGATFGGALSEGALGGLNAVYGQRSQQRQMEMDAAKAADDRAKNDAEVGYKTAQTGAIPSEIALRDAQAGAATTNANAALTNAGRGRFSQPVPGERMGADGKPEKGAWVTNLDTGDMVFKAGMTITGKPGSGGQTASIIDNLRKESPGLSYADALALAQRAPNADAVRGRQDALAQKAAKDDRAYRRDPEGTIRKWQKFYGVHGAPDGATALGGTFDDAVKLLKAHPNMKNDFDKRYGAGAAQRALGGQ